MIPPNLVINMLIILSNLKRGYKGDTRMYLIMNYTNDRSIFDFHMGKISWTPMLNLVKLNNFHPTVS